MANKRIIALLFLFVPFLCFGAVLKSESQFIDSGGKTILKTKISNLLPGQTAKLNIAIYSDGIGLKPISIFQKYITTSDLDKNGYYSYTLDSSFPGSQFKAVSDVKTIDIKKSGLASAGSNCSDEDICHEIIKMDQDGLILRIKYPSKNNVSKVGIECRREKGDIEEKFFEDNSLDKIKNKTITFKKKYQTDYYCQPYVVSSGFMGLKFADWGKEFLFPTFPSAKTLPLDYDNTNKILRISGSAKPGSQSYYYWFVIQDQKTKDLYCITGEVLPSSRETATFNLATNKNVTVNHCNADFTPNINSNRIFQFSPNVNYKIAFLIKGSQDKKIAGKDAQNFFPFMISGKLPTPNPISIEKNNQKGLIRISSYINRNETVMRQWFLIREANSGLKYRILDDNIKTIESDSEQKTIYYVDLRFGKIRTQELQSGKNVDFVFSINKKYYVSFCLENDIGKNCSEKIEPIDTSGMQKTIYGGESKYGEACTHESFASNIPLADAMKLVEKVGADMGIRKEFLLSILIQESNLGEGMGGCLYHSDTGKYCNARSQRDYEIFKKLCQDLGLDWRKIEVSCGGSGTGGAMGFAQFMPKEWITRSGKISSKTLHNPASPWNSCDATVAAAFYLKEKGAKANGSGERSAAIAYNGWAWYGDQVVRRTDCIKKYWNNPSAINKYCR